MRVVTWNMGCGPRPSPYAKRHAEAWAYLRNELKPDVALVQEALLARIEDARADYDVTACSVGPTAVAATAVLVRGFESSPGPSVAVSAETYAVSTSVQTPAGPITALSVHVYPGKRQHADLERLVELLAATFDAGHAVIGGDFNAARNFDVVYGGDKYQRFFDAMRGAGFHEAHWEMHRREVQTFWRPGTKQAYQDDHFFVSNAWASRVRGCDVVDNVLVRQLSDHGPVVLDLDVTGS